MVQEVGLSRRSIDQYEAYVGKEALSRLRAVANEALKQINGASVWNVNSTATGGGVAEMLHTVLGYGNDLGIDLKWLVIEGDTEFFRITKRLHNGIHGSPGDDGDLEKSERQHYEKVSKRNLEKLKERIRPGDYVFLHDPQTAGLVSGLREHGVRIIWRSHIGNENSNPYVQRSWDFLKPYLEEAEAFVFTLRGYAPEWVDPRKLCVIPPSIDAFSCKNQEMEEKMVASICHHIGLVQRPPGNHMPRPEFIRSNGEVAPVRRFADKMSAGPLPAYDDPMVVQVSRWDRLKDMLGVMNGFADHVIDGEAIHLVLVGPNVHGVSDDPEGVDSYRECEEVWRSLRHFKRNRVTLATLPTHDFEENAAMVNAIQRHATVIVQKSLYEGFGLTVTEAMWKGKPVVASAVGGIPSQIMHHEDGLLIKDATDLREYGETLAMVLHDKALQERLGRGAKRKVIENFLVPSHLQKCFSLLEILNH